MDINDYAPTRFGHARWTGGRHGYVAYFPEPIPRSLELSSQTITAMAEAEASLGRLAGAGRLLPNPQLLVAPYLRREAVASTRIEGTQASLIDVYEAQVNDLSPNPDVEEVLNYVAAFEAGMAKLEVLPFSQRLIREMHAQVLAGVRGQERQPGTFRTTQNWIGSEGATIETATFVPPPPGELGPLLDDLERFVHGTSALPPLIEAALLHYQFETIHPFLDGNGRLGRLLIAFFLILRERLPAPLLYLSPYFEQRRSDYYESLQMVRQHGDIERWLSMFLAAVNAQATDAVDRSEQLVDLREQYRLRVQTATRGAAVQLVDHIFEVPVLTAMAVERRLGVARPTALAALRVLEDADVVRPVGVGERGQLRWQATEVLQVLAAEAPG